MVFTALFSWKINKTGYFVFLKTEIIHDFRIVATRFESNEFTGKYSNYMFRLSLRERTIYTMPHF
jgi:hypothetical protein